MKKIMLIIGITLFAYNLPRFREFVRQMVSQHKSSVSNLQGSNAEGRKMDAEQLNQNNNTSYFSTAQKLVRNY